MSGGFWPEQGRDIQMVLGYMCETHGYRRECDVSEAGERLCSECGMAVTGLTGHSRSTRSSPPLDDSSFMSGNIEWHVRCDHSNPDMRVWAFDHEEAVESAIHEIDNPQSIKEVEPVKRQYRY